MLSELYLSIDAINTPLLRRLATLSKSVDLQVFVSSHFFDVCRGSQVVRVATRHLIYLDDILNSFDYYYGAVEPVEVDGKSIVDYSLPGFHLLKDFDLFPVFLPSFAEPFVTCSQYLEFAKLREGDVVLDLGAYCGITSIAFAERVGKNGKVIAVEADPENQRALEKNAALYSRLGGAAIDIVRAAVWKDCNGISFSSEGNMGSSAIEIVGHGRGNIVQSPSITLDSIAEQYSLSRVAFIKCDVEGAELHIFNSEFLRNFRPRIIIEPHIVNGVLCHEAVANRLRALDYRIEFIQQTGVALPLVCAVPIA
jgi:FkbM family methyltransferase